jgi:hypothetical protein
MLEGNHEQKMLPERERERERETLIDWNWNWNLNEWIVVFVCCIGMGSVKSVRTIEEVVMLCYVNKRQLMMKEGRESENVCEEQNITTMAYSFLFLVLTC